MIPCRRKIGSRPFLRGSDQDSVHGLNSDARQRLDGLGREVPELRPRGNACPFQWASCAHTKPIPKQCRIDQSETRQKRAQWRLPPPILDAQSLGEFVSWPSAIAEDEKCASITYGIGCGADQDFQLSEGGRQSGGGVVKQSSAILRKAALAALAGWVSCATHRIALWASLSGARSYVLAFG